MIPMVNPINRSIYKPTISPNNSINRNIHKQKVSSVSRHLRGATFYMMQYM